MTSEEEQVQAILGKSLLKETVLVLASDPAIRKVIRKALESVGYYVLAAGNLGAAMDLLKDCTPDLIMVRHYMENVSGHDAAMYMRLTYPGIPVLIVGGILDDEGLEDRETVYGFEIFPKPFQAVELLDKVKEVLVRSSLLRRRHASNAE